MTGAYSHSLEDSANHNHGNVLCTGKDDGSNHEQSSAVPVPQNHCLMRQLASAKIVLHACQNNSFITIVVCFKTCSNLHAAFPVHGAVKTCSKAVTVLYNYNLHVYSFTCYASRDISGLPVFDA